MSDPINILILSCGTRNKIVEYFKKELGSKGQVMATDSSELAPALYEADKHFIVPRMDSENYLEIILNICKENNIRGILSLIDPELTLLSKNKEKFLEIGTIPVVSDHELIELCFDKFEFYKYLVNNNINTIKSYTDKEEFYREVKEGAITYPVFVKPVKGSASININKVSSNEELDSLFGKYDNLMIQEYIDGIEYGADVYVDLISEEVKAIFIKEKLKMRAGETDKSVSVIDDKLNNLLKDFVEKTKFKGIVDIDVFKVGEEFYISEVNPRFGGGYPHAYEAGVNVPKMIIKNLENLENVEGIQKYPKNIYMLKYNDVKIFAK